MGTIKRYELSTDFIPDVKEAAESVRCDAKCLTLIRDGVTLWEVTDRNEKGLGSLWHFEKCLEIMGISRKLIDTRV